MTADRSNSNRHRASKRSLLVRPLASVGAAALLLAPPTAVLCMTANPKPFRMTQPDGTALLLRLNGDPTHQFLTDLDGYTCLQHPDNGYWYYAVRSSSAAASSNLRSERHKAGGELRPHPTALCGDEDIDPAELDGVDGRRMVPSKKIRMEKCGRYCQDREERQRDRNRRLLQGGEEIDMGLNDDGLPADGITGEPLLPLLPAVPLEHQQHTGSDTASLHRQLSGNTGTLRCLVIPIRFKDHVGRPLPTAQQLGVMINHSGKHPDYAPTGSVRYALREFSYGNLDLVSEVWDWVTVPKTEAEYSGGGMGLGVYFHEALTDALDIHNNARRDFKKYDVKENSGTGDGRIDAILFVHSGFGAEGGFSDCYGTSMQKLIWSHEWSLTRPWTSWDGVDVLKYAVNSAMFDNGMADQDGDGVGDCNSLPCCVNPPPIARVGSFIHEIMHYLDLPDLYDSKGGFGAGSWAIMANAWGHDDSQMNCPQLSPWSKSAFGWTQQLLITQDGTYEIDASWNTNRVFRINLGPVQPNGRVNEYLLIENKWKASFESTIPQAGLIIWSIDGKQTTGNELEGYPGMAGYPGNGAGYMVSVVQADGRYDLEKGENEGDCSDVFHGCLVDELGPASDPANPLDPLPNTAFVSPARKLESTQVRIYDISEAGQKMTFKVQFNYKLPSRTNPYGERKLYGPFDGQNKNAGVMFDMLPDTDMRITGFDVKMLSTDRHRMEVYYRYGSHIGHNDKKDSWTRLDDGNLHITGRGPECKVPLVGFNHVTVRKGQRVAFFIAHTEQVASIDDLKLAYSSGKITDATKNTWMNMVWFENEDLKVYQGTGQGYHPEFTNPNTFPARNPNIVVHYEYGLTARAPTPKPPTPKPTPLPTAKPTLSPTTFDACRSNPCKNGGTCRDTTTGYTCQCPSMWGGTNCDVDTDNGCVGSPCKNGATCTDKVGGYNCACPSGWGGTNCDVDTDNGCVGNLCKNGATCRDKVGGYDCVCASGWGGTNCDIDTDNGCVGSPCKNGGTCTDQIGGYKCQCPSTWGGENCDVDTNPLEKTRSDPGGVPTTTFQFKTGLDQGNNQAKGNMFDISAQGGNDLWLKSFSIHVDEAGANVPVKVYARAGGFAGFLDSTDGWTEICSTTVTSAGPEQPSKIPLGVCTPYRIPNGERHGLYITVEKNSPVNMRYTTGGSTAGVQANTERFRLYEGFGKGEDIVNTYGPSRRWNGEIFFG